MADSTPNKERLSEAQRKRNHIQSERMRREAVRSGFNQLSEIVPGMEDQGRSEVRVLSATVDYITEQLQRKQRIKERCKALGMSEGDFEQIYRDEEAEADKRQAQNEAMNGSSGGDMDELETPKKQSNGVKKERNGGRSSQED